MRTRICLRLAPVVVLALCAVSTFGQTVTSTILGTLVDPANAAIPNAQLTLTAKATGVARVVQSSDVGGFRFLDVPAGSYALRIEAVGFKSFSVNDIDLTSSETRTLGTLVLQLGAITEQVEVTAQPTPVQTSSSERSALVDGTQLQNVALKGRDAYGYVRLLPGIVDTNTSRDLASASSIGGISINGQSSSNKNVTLDGVSQMDWGGNGTAFVTPSLDAIAEVRVIANGFQAEYGRQAAGNISVITKNGTREFHGSGYWNRRHEDMNANTFFNNRQGIDRPVYRYFIGGFTVGGPVYVPKLFNTNRQKWFFFVSQEYTRVKLATTTATANMPTQAERDGDYSKSLSSVGKLIPVIDPTTGVQFPGNIIPKTRLDSSGQAILNLLPQPNGYVNPAPGQQYTANYKASQTGYHNRRNDIARIDMLLNDKTNLYLRAGRDTDDTMTPFTIGPGLGGAVTFLPGYQFAGHLTHTLSARMVNEFVFGIGHDNYGFYHTTPDSAYFRSTSLNPPTLRSAPLQYCTEGNESCWNTYKPYLPTFTFSGGSLTNPAFYMPSTSGYSGAGTTSNNPIPYKNSNDNFTLADNFSLVVGTHNIKTGLYLEKEVKTEPNDGWAYAGIYNFGSTVNNPLDTGHGYANALLGVFQTYMEMNNIVIPHVAIWDTEWYAQDNWRVNRKLTLDYGLRFYHSGPFHDDAGAYSGFYPQLWNSSQAARLYWPAMVNGKSVAIDRATGVTTYAALANTVVPGSGSAVNGMHVGGLTGKGDFYSFPSVSISPRIGFAWDPSGDGKMAVRASFGTFYNLYNSGQLDAQRGAPPVVYMSTVYYNYINQVSQAAAAAAVSPTASQSVQASMPFERAHQWNLTVQRSVGFNTVVDVGYVGNFDRHATQNLQLNPIAKFAYADPANLFNNTEVNADLLRTAYPGMGSITYLSPSLSRLNYHGLQVQAQHRMSHGLQFGASYTFSKALGTQGWDSYHEQRKWFYGPLSQDRAQTFTINYSYALPSTGSRIGVVRHVLDNWMLSGITTFQTGAPVTPACSSLDSGPANSDPSLSGVGFATSTSSGGARCQQVADPKQFQKSFYTAFNTSAFTVAAPMTWGDAGLGILRQPAWSNWDMTLEKRIRIANSDRRVVRLRLEAYNVFNHAEFSTLGTTLSLRAGVNTNTTYGQYTATQSPRQMSTTLRFEF